MALFAIRAFIVLSLSLTAALGILDQNPQSARAQDSLRPAAVVNDEVISVFDLVMRTRLAILGSGVKDTQQTRNRISKQVLRRLIDERLQLQEATRLDITVDDAEIDEAVDGMAQQNKMTRQKFIETLRRRGVLETSLTEQIRARLAWQAVAARRLRPSVNVSDQEVDEIVASIQATQGDLQYRVGEIFLAVENAQQEDEVVQNAGRLVEQLRSGANFSGLARQFSQSATANLGGDLGWISKVQLGDELSNALSGLKPGDFVGPVRTLSGYSILLLREQRQATETEIDRDRIRQDLFRERLNRLARRSMEDLRRAANIDIRI